jgi:hypothetical protein
VLPIGNLRATTGSIPGVGLNAQAQLPAGQPGDGSDWDGFGWDHAGKWAFVRDILQKVGAAWAKKISRNPCAISYLGRFISIGDAS